MKFFKKGDIVVCIKDAFAIKRGMVGTITKIKNEAIWVDFGGPYGLVEMRDDEIELKERK